MKEVISIVFAINEEYVAHCCVSVISILENNKIRQFNVYILTDYLSLESRELFQEVENEYFNVSVRYVLLDSKPFKLLKKRGGYITEHTLYRYVIGDILPNLDKALYLDADLIVNGDIEPLWNVDLEGYYCAGTEDLFIKQTGYKRKIGLREDDIYINAGVLLLNLANFRRDNIKNRLCAHTTLFINRDLYQDQDAINYVCQGRIKLVSCCYNFTSANALSMTDVIDKAIIIHYTGAIKPWREEYSSIELKNLYGRYSSLLEPIWGRLVKKWMERAIVLFRQAKKTGEENWEEMASAVLDRVLEGCYEGMPVTYGHGLCGIGVGVEYLIQEGLVEGNSDEILQEIDFKVYSVINQRALQTIGLEDGTSGLAYYLYYRLCRRKESEDKIVLQAKEYLIYLIDWIADLLPISRTLSGLGDACLVLCLIRELNVLNAKVDKLIDYCLREIFILKAEIEWK